MGKLTCPCLNVKIFTTTADMSPVKDISELGLHCESTEEFYKQQLYHAHLSIDGILVEQPCLVKQRLTAGWNLHCCHGCGHWTHATPVSNAGSEVLVSAQLQSDPEVIERLSKTSDFSPLYQIVLSADRATPTRTLGVETARYESLQRALTTIQQRLNKFLLDEEAALEIRIRTYEAAQRTSYNTLQSKARKDKNTMISLLLAAEDSGSTCQDTSISSPATSEERDGASVGDDASHMSSPVETPPPPPSRQALKKKHLSSSSSSCEDRPKSRHLCRHQKSSEADNSGSPDADGLFDIDPAFEDDTNQPFYESEDDTEDTDDSSVEEGRRGDWRRHAYSTSVPISVPLWKTDAHSALTKDDDEPAPDHANMAASIKALAKSVHGGTNDLFGDLPRPPCRVTRLDFGKL